MYTVHIGRRFLELYNARMGCEKTPLEFYNEVYWPLFFNCADEKQMQQVHGSWFFQPDIAKKNAKTPHLIPGIRKDSFLKAVTGCSQGNEPVTGGIAVGFMSTEESTTSGQVTDVDQRPTLDDSLCSWFGAGLGIGFGGGVDFLAEDEDLIWYIYEGWRFYRKYLTDTNNLKGRQIETWNGLWILLGLAHRRDIETAYNRVTQSIGAHSSEAAGVQKLNRPEWHKQLLAMARELGGRGKMLHYGYSYGSMNKTYGFLYFDLPKVRTLPQLYDQLLAEYSTDYDRKETPFEEVYRTQYSLERAVQTGGVGLRALTPKDLYKYMGGRPDLPKIDEKNIHTFFTYLTWIEAMLDNPQTLALADELATALKVFATSAKNPNERAGSTARANKVDKLWEAKSRTAFINELDELLQDKQPADPDVLNKAVETVMLHIPGDQFSLFHTLVKFRYHFLSAKNNQTLFQS